MPLGGDAWGMMVPNDGATGVTMASTTTHAVDEHRVTVNGAPRALDGTDPSTTALDWLRAQGLTGAKEGCAEGECGACSIMVARPTEGSGTQWTAINACLVPVAALDGQEVVTSEGLGRPDALHPVQRHRLPESACRSKPLGPCSWSGAATGSFAVWPWAPSVARSWPFCEGSGLAARLAQRPSR